MDNTDQNIKEAIANLQNVLENANDNDLGELKSFVIQQCLNWVSRWSQCDQMTKLDSYAALRDKIDEISNDGDTQFYIGYTKKLGDYLWTTTPKSKKYKSCGLVKSHTFYTHLKSNPAETERNLIDTFFDYPKCLNGNRCGLNLEKGIVYVLVYKSPSGN